MFDDQTKVSPKVARLFEQVIRKQMAHLDIVRIYAEGRDDGWEDGPILRVSVEILNGGKDVDPVKYGGLWPILLSKLEKKGETRWPVITFKGAKEAQNAAS